MNRSLLTSSGLGFIAGYVDTVGFIALFGLFTAHITGNFVLIGSELAHPTHGVLVKLLAFPAFVAAVVLSRLLALRAAHSERSAARQLLLLQGVLLAACMLAGFKAHPVADANSPWVLITGVLAAAAMGVQNAAGRLAFSNLAPTAVMTGNVTQVVIDLVDLLRDAADAGVRERILKFAGPVVAFAAGAICGAFAYFSLAFWALLVPLAILAAMLMSSLRE